ncbi:MAG: GSCFA domain-containing protein [Paludibacter sp.]|nr:GSCFA domain-containing protein [Paludibacter sp.]
MFNTPVKIQPLAKKINHNSKLITLGSCFSEHIGKKLAGACFMVDSNPFGILFNPASIKNSIFDLLAEKKYTKEDLFLNGSLWSSFSHSTLFSDTDQEVCLQNINNRLDYSIKMLKEADFILITFGTAWVYELKENGRLVANCHKLPAEKFIRRRLSVEEIVKDYADLLIKIKVVNPQITVIFTVSPVRHWKDGAYENNISKGILHLAIDSLCSQFDFLSYFPAYEILMDELRDYRFYAEDMLHPASITIDFIWKKFIEFCMNEETKEIVERVEDIRLQEKHQSIHPNSSEHKLFLENLNEKKRKLMHDYPIIKI